MFLQTKKSHISIFVKLIFIYTLLFNIKINYSQDIKVNDSIVINDTINKPALLLGKITRNAKGYIKIDKSKGKL